VKCQWGYVTGNHWANYGPYGSPVSHCCNCKGFQMPENYADGYWTTAPASWVWNGNWKNTHTSTGTELPICDPTNAPTETPTPSPTSAPTETPTPSPTNAPTETPTSSPVECTDNCVSTPGWTIDSNPVTTCGWMEHICGPMRRGECLEHGGNVKCQWGYVTGNHWANYGPYGSPVSHCCNCKGFQMPENYADGYWTTAPASWVWNGNWKNTHTSTGTELPICDPTNAPTETPTSSPVECTVKYTRHRGMIRYGNNWMLSNDDLIPTDPVCVRNDDWTPPFCRDGKFPQGLAIGIDRCKVACAARPKCKAIAMGHPTRGTAAECYLAGVVNDQDNPLMTHGNWDFYDIDEVCEPALDTLPDLKFYLKVEDYTSGNAWVDRVSNIEVHVPGSASFHEGYVHLSGTAITAPLQTNPNVMQSATYVIRLRVPTIPSNLGWVMSQFPDFGWSRALTISDYRLGHVGQTPGHFQSGLGSFPTDTWQVLVGTWTQGGACQTFLQGTSGNPRTCSNGAGTVSNEKLIIGGRGETDAGHNPGSIDISDVLVFNRILNTDEINFITSTLSEPKPCPALKCTMHCDTGYVIDANGCETCQCLPTRRQLTGRLLSESNSV